MREYWNRPEETAAAFRGGWYHTGDAGYLDEDGYLYLVDRLKDMIVTGGENVYSTEVENAITEHPAVLRSPSSASRTTNGANRSTPSSCCMPGARSPKPRPARPHPAIQLPATRCRNLPIQGRSATAFGALKVLKRELRAPFWQGRERRGSIELAHPATQGATGGLPTSDNASVKASANAPAGGRDDRRAGGRRSLRRWQAVAVSVSLGLAMGVLAPLMRDAWPQRGRPSPSGPPWSTTAASLAADPLRIRALAPQDRGPRTGAAATSPNARNSERQAEPGAGTLSYRDRRSEDLDARRGQHPPPALPVEALIADSSRAHLRRQASTGVSSAARRPDRGRARMPGELPVGLPGDGHVAGAPLPGHRPARHLPVPARPRGRGGVPLTAVCLPMASRGQAVGVLHSVRAAQTADPDPTLVHLRSHRRSGPGRPWAPPGPSTRANFRRRPIH